MFLRPAAPPTVNLALQGGGAHGAFTWGVLDALLEDGRLAFEGVASFQSFIQQHFKLQLLRN